MGNNFFKVTTFNPFNWNIGIFQIGYFKNFFCGGSNGGELGSIGAGFKP
jgi:hypothetical protein